jgi:hypothetical protein
LQPEKFAESLFCAFDSLQTVAHICSEAMARLASVFEKKSRPQSSLANGMEKLFGSHGNAKMRPAKFFATLCNDIAVPKRMASLRASLHSLLHDFGALFLRDESDIL